MCRLPSLWHLDHRSGAAASPLKITIIIERLLIVSNSGTVLFMVNLKREGVHLWTMVGVASIEAGKKPFTGVEISVMRC